MQAEIIHHKRLSAAIRRRDDGASAPFLWDNTFLAIAGEAINPRTPVLPNPASLSAPERRMLELLTSNPLSARELADAVGLNEIEVRRGIDQLRDPNGWWIENDRRGRFLLVPLPPLKAVA